VPAVVAVYADVVTVVGAPVLDHAYVYPPPEPPTGVAWNTIEPPAQMLWAPAGLIETVGLALTVAFTEPVLSAACVAHKVFWSTTLVTVYVVVVIGVLLTE